ncbi:MAG: DUF962 domain-containing protein [Casimicrobiaceae bacterium]|nr:DUF962 domain-containing protein [Casimicrobiaceae bacterium]MDW8312037.1 DUF962 domain-containing protein [Burkholderiales bacterium]
MDAHAAPRFTRFRDFYPFYLGEHQHPMCRMLHFIGTTLGLIFLLAAIPTGNAWLILVGLIQGYAWAWVGHFAFEKNKPASFKQPLYSFLADWVMWFELLTGRQAFNPRR